jgi:hypothetical protein
VYRSDLGLILRSSTLWLDEHSDGEAGFAAIAHVGFCTGAPRARNAALAKLLAVFVVDTNETELTIPFGS